MGKRECIAMVLAGGKGERLGALTNDIAKPAVHFGGKYRIIDFTLSNCTHSGVDVLGVLTQYQASGLHAYINNGQTWDLQKQDGGVFMLPSSQNGGQYTGTANAVYQNISFIERFNPEYVIILSGDHIYKMDYRKMLNFHKMTNADATIAVIPVPSEEASKYGILSIDKNCQITEFAEKPKQPKSNLASMGIYIFPWSRLKHYLIADKNNLKSENDFGKNVIPAMLAAGDKLFAYQFKGYWKDVGTVQSLWESNLDLIKSSSELDLQDKKWEILTKTQPRLPYYITGKADIINSIVAEGCKIHGQVKNSVLFDSVKVSEGAEVVESVIMPNVVIGKNVKIYRAIIGEGSLIGQNAKIGMDEGNSVFVDHKICSSGISLIGPEVCIKENIRIKKNSHIDGILPQQGRQKLLLNN